MKSFIVAALAAMAAAAPATKRGSDAPRGDKKGLAYNEAGVTASLAMAGGASWAYNWGVSTGATKYQQIPMMWSTASDVNAISAAAAKAPWVMGYNEPDMCGNGGSDIAPAAAAAAWVKQMVPIKQKNPSVKLLSPAITSNETPKGPCGFSSGLDWLSDFHAAGSNGLQIDGVALHWYGAPGQSGAAQGQLFINYIKHANDRVTKIFGKSLPLWITEFSALPVQDQTTNADFLKTVIPFLNGAAYVDRYSFFKAEFMWANNALTPMGAAYVHTN